jgi:hypothetical protein
MPFIGNASSAGGRRGSREVGAGIPTRLAPAPYGLTEYELNLAVHAAQFIRRPAFNVLPQKGVGPQEECLAFVSHS